MSTKTLKGGRLPLSEKETTTVAEFGDYDFDQNLLKIDPKMAKALSDKGFAIRWINAGNYRKAGNFHKSGWRAYRVDESLIEESRGSVDFSYGISPEGYLMRNDLILAVKPKEHQDRHRQMLREKADRQSGKSLERKNSGEFREAAARAGAKVYEGYDENE